MEIYCYAVRPITGVLVWLTCSQQGKPFVIEADHELLLQLYSLMAPVADFITSVQGGKQENSSVFSRSKRTMDSTTVRWPTDGFVSSVSLWLESGSWYENATRIMYMDWYQEQMLCNLILSPVL